MFGLENRHVDFIKEILQKHLPNSDAKFYIFGSRAKGNYREYSDVDIAIDSPDLTLDKKLQIQSDFDNSTFPYEVDIVDLKTIQENFKNFISADLAEIKISDNDKNR